jgi:DNA-binding response OmpR family regulator
MRVLVVDDNEDIRVLMTYAMRVGGHQIVSAADGHEALTKVRTESVDAVILDVQMPDMAGWDVLERIRGMPELNELPVVMCTVKGRNEDLERGWDLGCDGYVSKPFDVTELLAEVEAVVGRTREERKAVREAGLREAREVSDHA